MWVEMTMAKDSDNIDSEFPLSAKSRKRNKKHGLVRSPLFVILQLFGKRQYETDEIQKQNPRIGISFQERLTAIHLLLKSRIQRGIVFTTTTMAGLLVASSLHPPPLLLVLAPLTTMLSTLAIYFMNDIVDVKIDKINATNRPLASGKVRRSEALVFVTMLAAGSLVIAFLLNGLAVLLVSLYLLLGILYSIPKISLKDRFAIKTTTIAVGGLLTSLIGSSSLHTLSTGSLIAAVSFMILIFVTSPINDLADYVGDSKYGKRTIPVVIGTKKTVILAISLPFVIAGLFWAFHESWNFSIITPIALTFLSTISFLILYPVYKKRDNYKYVRMRHKKAVFLHYGLQISLLVGLL